MFDDLEGVLHAVQSRFEQLRVLVVGDLMLDRYVFGDVGRISPEAPVPVVRQLREHETPGGAANVAMNAAGLGCQVSLIGFVGVDEHRERLLAQIQVAGIRTNSVISAATHPTTTKVRIMGGHQQMLRLDVEASSPFEPETTAAISAAVTEEIEQGCDVVVLSDYAKGVLSEPVCARAIERAASKHVPILVDPKGRDFSKYAGATTISPNRSELAAATGTSASDLESLLNAAERLRHTLQLDFVTLTRSEQGITIIDAVGAHHAPATAREVFDVSGAGDTVIATIASAISSGISTADAARLANLAAGVVVAKLGTVPIAHRELLREIRATVRPITPIPANHKLLDLNRAEQRLAEWRSRGEVVVFTNGVFDILHAGHVGYLDTARKLGDRLIVGLNTDESVRRLKGPTRPINNALDRASVLAGLQAVDLVVMFGDDTPLSLITALQPDVLVKGADYSVETVAGAAEVLNRGGRVEFIPLLEGRSTTRTIETLQRYQ